MTDVAPCRGVLVRKRQAGFTIMEILIVLSIVGILSALVLPAYTKSAQKSRRADARSTLSDLATRQEKYYAQNDSYAASISPAGTGLGWGKNTSLSDYYKLSVAVDSSCGTILNCYTLRARAIGSQTDDSDCQLLTLDNAGRKRAYNSQGQLSTDKCW